MADLAVGDVTLTLEAGKPLNPRIAGTKRYAHNKITFGDAAKTYPSGGIPLPTFEKWGLIRHVESVLLDDPGSASAYTFKYDTANHKLRMYQAGAELAAAVDAPAAQTLYGLAIGW